LIRDAPIHEVRINIAESAQKMPSVPRCTASLRKRWDWAVILSLGKVILSMSMISLKLSLCSRRCAVES
jgi:hypothetical protein